MTKIFDTKMYEDYAKRHDLESPWSCLIHVEFKNKEGDFVMIGDTRPMEMTIAKIICLISKNSGDLRTEIIRRIAALCLLDEYKEGDADA